VYHWDRGAGTDNWTDGANWYHTNPIRNNTVPIANSDLVFGSMPSGTGPLIVNQNTANLSVRSLWFEAGRDYTLQTNNVNLAGSFLMDAGGSITVLTGGTAENRYTINLPITLTAGTQTFEIANYSDGLLDLRGGFNPNGNSLHVYGGATHIVSLSSMTGTLTVGGLPDQLTTLLLSSVQTWPYYVDFVVSENGLFITKAASNVYSVLSVQSRGTLALRASSDVLLGVTAQGDGVARREGGTGIGAIYNEGGDIAFSAVITLTGDTRIGSRAGRTDKLTLSGFGGNFDFEKVGSGLISVGNAGGLAQSISLNGGVLQYNRVTFDTYSLPGGNIRFNGGILEFGTGGLGELSRSLGTGSNQLRWLGDGGFSGQLTVTLNNGGELFWGAGRFVPNQKALLLSSRYSDGVVTFTNAINLGSELREVRVARGSNSYASARMSGALSDDDLGGGIEKTGQGLLRLDSTGNSYTGATLIREGALRGNIPTNSNIELEGGVLGLDGNFTRNRFGNGGRIIWQDSGGFAAYGANRLVRIDNQTTSEIGWGWTNFVQADQELRFGHYTADAAVIWDRALNFGDAMRTIRVERGLAVGSTPNLTDVIFNRALNNSAKTGGLRLVGDGRADLAADSSSLNSDNLEISGAELRLSTANARLGAIGNITLSEGGRLTLTNQNNSGSDSAQIADTTAITFNTGEVRYEGRGTGPLASLPSTEKIGNLALTGGANTIHLAHNAGAQTGYTEIEVQSLQRAATARATLNLTSNFSSSALDHTYGSTGRVRFRASSTLAGHMIGGISPWATINGTDWATTDSSNANYIAALALQNYSSGNSGNRLVNTWNVVFGTVTLNSLKLVSYFQASQFVSGWYPASAYLNGTLTLSSGGLLSTGVVTASSDRNSIMGTGTLTTAANRPLYTHVYGNGLEFNNSARVVGGIDWVKTGPSPLRYNSTGTSQIGSLYVHQGTVELNNGAFNTGANGQVFIGDGAGRDTLVISGGTNRLANRPKVTLRGTPYGRGAEFGADEAQATLAITNGATQSLRELHIIDRGTLDFTNGNPAAPNRLFLDLLTFNNASAQLFVRGWHEYEDFLLIKKTAYAVGRWPELLSQIWFDGYSLDYSLLVKDYNNDYYQITPWGDWAVSAMPEPSTCGALLGLVGLGLWTWRKRTQRLGLRPRRCAQNGRGH